MYTWTEIQRVAAHFKARHVYCERLLRVKMNEWWRYWANRSNLLRHEFCLHMFTCLWSIKKLHWPCIDIKWIFMCVPLFAQNFNFKFTHEIFWHATRIKREKSEQWYWLRNEYKFYLLSLLFINMSWWSQLKVMIFFLIVNNFFIARNAFVGNHWHYKYVIILKWVSYY